MPDAASAGGAEELRIHLLGGFRVCVGSRVIDEAAWRLRKSSGLVKLLALSSGHRLHREQIIDLLWPDLTPEAASTNLRVTLHAARRALGRTDFAACLRRQREWLALCPPASLWTDVEAFRAAAVAARRSQDPAAYAKALDRYIGDLLPEDCYEDWAEGPREELRALRLSLLVELARLHEVQGRPEPAIEALEQVVSLEPMREEAHVALMRLYALSGRRPQALGQYQRLQAVLRQELDAEPDAESQRLYLDILAGRRPAAATPALSGTPSPGPLERWTGGEARPTHNLPSPLTSFVGREDEIAAVKQLLRQVGSAPRLLTLTGTGGCGKTRLALEIARDLVVQYPDGAWFVELAALTDPALVEQAVASALGLPEEPGRRLTETIVSYLRPRRALLVLDNCEHLAAACAMLTDALLRACPKLQVVATSRQPLGMAGEALWRVRSLWLPDLDHLPPLGCLTQCEAVRLFVDRARLVQPDLELTTANACAVAQICHRLDGLPLAIELAAARVSVLAPEQIAARLDDRFRLLAGGGVTTLPRHQTLRGAIDWSYQLLSEAERTLFMRLSVFAGGCTLDAVETVCAGVQAPTFDVQRVSVLDVELGTLNLGGGALDVLDLLAQLVDKSLVLADPAADGEVRYRLLETLRQYARDRLLESGESGRVRQEHAGYYLRLVEQAEAGWFGPEQLAWLRRVELEHDNLRAALAWSIQADPELALRLAATSLRHFLHRATHFTEAQAWLHRALERAGETPSAPRAKALETMASIAWQAQLDFPAARAFAEESLAIRRQLRDQRGIGASLYHLGQANLRLGEYAASRLCLEESLAIRRELDDRRAVAESLFGLGELALDQAHYHGARAHYGEGLAILRTLNDQFAVAMALLGLGTVAVEEGDAHEAEPLFTEGLGILRELPKRAVIAYALESVASVAAMQAQPHRALRLAGAARALREEVGTPKYPPAQIRLDRRLALARCALSESACAAAWEEGRAMPVAEAIEYALAPVAS